MTFDQSMTQEKDFQIELCLIFTKIDPGVLISGHHPYSWTEIENF